MNTITSSQPQQQPASISIADLQNMLAIVDLATSRGAFRGPELSQVGQVFDRVNSFLQSVTPQDNQPAQTDAASTQMAQTPPMPQPVTPQPQQVSPTPVMPMSPPFSPKVGV